MIYEAALQLHNDMKHGGPDDRSQQPAKSELNFAGEPSGYDLMQNVNNSANFKVIVVYRGNVLNAI